MAWLVSVALLLVGQRLNIAASKCDRENDDYCRTDQSIPTKALLGLTHRTLQNKKPHECYQACDADLICQSFNYVTSNETCELNNRTIDARPGNFITDLNRFYVTVNLNRGNGKINNLSCHILCRVPNVAT